MTIPLRENYPLELQVLDKEIALITREIGIMWMESNNTSFTECVADHRLAPRLKRLQTKRKNSEWSEWPYAFAFKLAKRRNKGTDIYSFEFVVPGNIVKRNQD